MNIRQTTIVEFLEKNKRVDVRALAEHLGVSTMTIRRDLNLLHNQGFLVRTHGGGMSAGKLSFLHAAFPHYALSPEKVAIGKLAATLVTPGQTVMVDGGTTALEVARNLPKDADITVVTTSLCVVQELFRSPVNVLLLGGHVRREFPSLYGPLTEETLKRIHVDTLFIGCDGADSRFGFYMSDYRLSNLEQQLIQSADRVVLVTESAKFGRKSLVQYATLEEVNTLVTDARLSLADRKRLEESDVTILVAETN